MPTPQQDLVNDALLTASESEILRLSGDQLESLIDWLANCRPAPTPEGYLPCARATIRADIKLYGRDATNRIRTALHIADGTIPWGQSGVPDQKIRDIVMRRELLFRRVQEAASFDYVSLKSGGK